MINYLTSWHWSTKLMVTVGAIAILPIWLFESKRDAELGAENILSVQHSIDSLDEVRASSEIGDEPLRNLPPLETFSAMVDRPLFSSARRKAESDIVAEDAQRPEPTIFPLLRFVGTIDKGQKIEALTDGPQGLRVLSVGDHFDGWQVVVVEARRMVLVRQNEHLDLQILDHSS